MKTNNEYFEMYPYIFLFKNKKIIFIWQTSKNSHDSFMTDENNKLLSSANVNGFKKTIPDKFDSIHWNEGAEINFDQFWNTIKNLRIDRASSNNTCERLIEGWNFIEDLLYTFDLKEEIDKLKTPSLNKVYSKLFYGNNLPAVTPNNQSYSPVWTKRELKTLRTALREVWDPIAEQKIKLGGRYMTSFGSLKLTP